VNVIVAVSVILAGLLSAPAGWTEAFESYDVNMVTPTGTERIQVSRENSQCFIAKQVDRQPLRKIGIHESTFRKFRLQFQKFRKSKENGQEAKGACKFRWVLESRDLHGKQLTSGCFEPGHHLFNRFYFSLNRLLPKE
jgi:hypothetical protein